MQEQVARNQSLRKEKNDVVVVVKEGKITDARNSFFQSMMTNKQSSSSSSSRLGTSIIPAGIQESSQTETKEAIQTVHTTSSRKGKDLFRRQAEKQAQEETESTTFTSQNSTTSSSTFSSESSSSSTVLQVDFEVKGIYISFSVYSAFYLF